MTQAPKGADPESYASASTDAPAPPADLSGRILMAFLSLPSQIHHKDGTFSLSHVRGNLSIYLTFYYLSQQTKWETHMVGWTGEILGPHGEPQDLRLTVDQKKDLVEQMASANASEHIHPVWLLRDPPRWRRYAELVLWPVLHYINPRSTGSVDEEQWWTDYVRFNEAYATAICSIYKPGDIVWIHDYYLFLLPNILRSRLKDVHIALHVHTPFPSLEYFRCLLRRLALLEGMLGATRIAFENESFLRHFVSLAARVLGCDAAPSLVTVYGHTTLLEAAPGGIDAAKIVTDAYTEEADNLVASIRKNYGLCRIVVGRDRLDPVRGVLQKIEAFGRLLEMYPEWIGKVVLVQVLLRSPGFDEAYERLVAEQVQLVNNRYGTLEYRPIHHLLRIARPEYLALLRAADLGLITLVRDGSNTTALEYVACQRDGGLPLVLLEFSGSTAILPEATVVNPWDAVGVARSVHECLNMPQEKRKALAERLYKLVQANTMQHATNAFLRHFIEGLGEHEEHLTPPLDRPLLLRAYEKSERRLFLFDYDGTLAPIVKDPDAAIPTQRALRVLQKLADDPKNRVWIILGRDQQFLDRWLGSKVPKLGLLAEHGCFVKDVGGGWVGLAESMDMTWQKDVEEVMSYYTERTPGLFIERKKVALTWHYRKADHQFGELQAREMKQHIQATMAKKYDVEVMSGKANVEVRPRFVNKGEVAKRLALSAHGASFEAVALGKSESVSEDKLPDFIFCIGDDKTDEDMFDAVNHISNDEGSRRELFPVTVGPASKQTVARAHLLEPAEVLDTVGLLVGEVLVFETGGSVEVDDRGHIMGRKTQ